MSSVVFFGGDARNEGVIFATYQKRDPFFSTVGHFPFIPSFRSLLFIPKLKGHVEQQQRHKGQKDNRTYSTPLEDYR